MHHNGMIVLCCVNFLHWLVPSKVAALPNLVQIEYSILQVWVGATLAKCSVPVFELAVCIHQVS